MIKSMSSFYDDNVVCLGCMLGLQDWIYNVPPYANVVLGHLYVQTPFYSSDIHKVYPQYVP